MMSKYLTTFGVVIVIASLLASVLLIAVTPVEGATGVNYTIGKNFSGRTTVQDSGGRVVYTSSDSRNAIQNAIDRTPSGGIVMIKAGTYTLGAPLDVKAGVTISGMGTATVLRNGEIGIHASGVTVKSLKMAGTCHILITPTSADISGIVIKDVSATIGAVEAAYMVLSNNYKVSNVQFIRDTVTNSASAGFILTGKALISDVYFESCKATGLGKTSRYNDWVTGFILAQNAEVRNIKAVGCEASTNWESGFYLKPSITKTNVALQDCVANNNGQKPNYQEGYGYLLDSTVSMVNCVGTGNKGGLTNLGSAPDPTTKGTSSIALTAASSSVQIGTSIQISGSLKGTSSSGTTGIGGATVSLKVVLPDGTTANPTQGATVTTDASGGFVMNYVPTKVGSYKLEATFGGDTAFSGSSAVATVGATESPVPAKSPSTVSLSLASSSVEANKNVQASGVLSGSSAIAGATVTLSVTLPDGTTANPTQGATVTTDSSGRFTMSYVPTMTGTYQFTATFAGNAQYVASSSTVSFNAAAPATPAPTTSYDYIVSSSVVKTANGATAYTGSSFTAALQWALSQGGKVTYVPAGNYAVTGSLNMAGGSSSAKTTLVGDGDGTSGTVLTFTASSEGGSRINMNGVSNVAMKKVRIVSGAVVMQVSGGTIGNFLFEDVTMYQTNINQPNGRHEASFMMAAFSSGTIDGVSYYRCKVIQGGAVGFEPYGDFTGWVKNVYYEDCLCDRIGLDANTRFNPWVVGFDISESAKVDTITYVRCTAQYIWEAGFHCEPNVANNVVIRDCVANYCGQKPESFANPEGLPPGPYFGNGYFWSPYQSQIHISLVNCQGTGNANGDLYHDATTPNPLGYQNGDLPPTG